MRLIASVIVRNELGRYLEPCLTHLLGFCDEVRVLDNGSTDGWEDELRELLDGGRLVVQRDAPEQGGAFHGHSLARQRLLDLTLAGDPTHILAIDADEFVSDPAALRAACLEDRIGSWGLCMQEVWAVERDRLRLRQDGGWSEHDVFMLWRPDLVRGPLTITDRGPATGRTPDALNGTTRGYACSACLHLGWASVGRRQERYERYVEADGGRFHAKAHLDSILWPDERVRLTDRAWPDELLPYRPEILRRTV